MIVSQKYQDLLQPNSCDRFSKNIKNFLCKQKNVNNCSIPSTNADRKITNLSDYQSFTLHPSLSPYSQTKLRRNGFTEKQIHSLHVGWRNLFSSCAVVCQFFDLAGNRCWCYLHTQSTIQLWRCVIFLVLVGNCFWFCIRTQCTKQLCGYVSFLVVAGKSSRVI